MTAHKWMMIVLALYAASLLAAWLPGMIRRMGDLWRNEMRRENGVTTLVLLLLIAVCTLSVGEAIASKGGGGPTNHPPASVSVPGRINLYSAGEDGHLVPLDAMIREFEP